MNKKANTWVLVVVGVVALFAVAVMLRDYASATGYASNIPSTPQQQSCVTCPNQKLVCELHSVDAGMYPAGLTGYQFCTNKGYDTCVLANTQVSAQYYKNYQCPDQNRSAELHYRYDDTQASACSLSFVDSYTPCRDGKQARSMTRSVVCCKLK